MNKLATILLAASAAIAGNAFAQSAPPYAPLTTDIQARTPYSAYVQDSRGVIVRNPFGLCWRTGYWTPADAVPGCDAPLCVPPEKLENGKCVAPPPAPAPAPVAEPAPAPAPAPVAQQPNYVAMGVGALVGGLAGNQVGDGNGRKAATVAGVIGGAMLGNHIANRQKQQ